MVLPVAPGAHVLGGQLEDTYPIEIPVVRAGDGVQLLLGLREGDVEDALALLGTRAQKTEGPA
jgi:hypothetical protein